MSNYSYPTSPNTLTFGNRDTLPTSSGEKVIRGKTLDPEFQAISVMSQTKMENTNPSFTGIMSGGVIDGGTF